MLNARTSTLDGALNLALGANHEPGVVMRPASAQAPMALPLIGLGVLVVLGAIAALVVAQRRRRATAHCAALLAGSAPLGLGAASGAVTDGRRSSRVPLGTDTLRSSDAVRSDPAPRSSRVPLGSETPRSSHALRSDAARRSSRVPLGSETPRSNHAQSDEAPRSSRASLGSETPRSDQAVGERSAPASVPPSGINVPPPSERQWLSQPPPRSYKEPPG